MPWWSRIILRSSVKSTRAAADMLYNNFVLQFGFPERIHSDQGGEFTSNLFREIQRLAKIESSTTTPYHPEGIGQTERMNRTVCSMLKTLSENAKKDWKSSLPKLAFAYNSTVHRSTGFSPMYLMFGREARLPLDLMFQEVAVDDDAGIRDRSHKKFVENWHESMKEAMELARANMDKAAKYNKQYHDKKAKVVEINVGDRVLVRNKREKGGTGKLKSYWEEAIFVVEGKKEGLPVYKVKNLKKGKDVRVVHRNLLMKCEDLPLDVFDEPQEEKTTKKDSSFQTRKSKRRQQRTPLNNTDTAQHVEVIPDTNTTEESDDQDLAIILEEMQGGNSDYVEIEEIPGANGSQDTDDSLLVLDDTTNTTLVGNEMDPVGERSDESVDHGDVTDGDEIAETSEQGYESAVDESAETVPGADEIELNETDIAEEDATVAYGDESISTVAYDEEMDDTIVRDESIDITESIMDHDLSESEDVDLADDDQEPVRRSGRDRRPAKTLSYDTIGGDPVMKAVGRK